MYFIKYNSVNHLTHAGTGKTVIDAFDYRNFRKKHLGEACRLLFVAHREEKQVNAKNIELFVCDYVMQFLVSLQKRAEGVPFAKAAVSAADDFVRRCQVAGYGMLSILKKGSTAVGKADVVSPLFRLVNSVDVDGWAEFTYQSLVRARTVYLGYYIDLEKMDEELEEG